MTTYSLFECYGIELEYMIVDAKTLNIKPISDKIIQAASGAISTDFENGSISWANELVKHVLEVRTEEPATTLDNLASSFEENIATINKLAAPFGACLMPTSMHPMMDPSKQTVIWEHAYGDIFATFNRLFNCHQHGWANIQSCQLNLPFSTDDEFGRLHAAIRLILPILPALASSSPIVQLKFGKAINNRLLYYQSDFGKLPNMAGRCIPEQVFSLSEYKEKILKPLFAQLDTLPNTKILQHEWVNARGAILRKSRNAIEIRIMDMQECPAADIAICRAITDVLRNLVSEFFVSYKEQQKWTIDSLKKILDDVIQNGEETKINNKAYLSLFDFPEQKGTAKELWHHLIENMEIKKTTQSKHDYDIVRTILKKGVLSRRIKNSIKELNPANITDVYRQLAEGLAQGKMFGV